MRLRLLLTTAVAIAALVSFGVVPMPTAHAALADKLCFDDPPTVVGTWRNDVISVSSMATGTTITVNGKTRLAPWDAYLNIVSGDGNDRISFETDGSSQAVVCSGSGDDVLDVMRTDAVSMGSGKDRVNLYLRCSNTPIIYGAETVDILGFESPDEPAGNTGFDEGDVPAKAACN